MHRKSCAATLFVSVGNSICPESRAGALEPRHNARVTGQRQSQARVTGQRQSQARVTLWLSWRSTSNLQHVCVLSVWQTSTYHHCDPAAWYLKRALPRLEIAPAKRTLSEKCCMSACGRQRCVRRRRSKCELSPEVSSEWYVLAQQLAQQLFSNAATQQLAQHARHIFSNKALVPVGTLYYLGKPPFG